MKKPNNLDVDPYGSEETVLFSFKDPDLVIHNKREECKEETPHLMIECGCFTPIKSIHNEEA